ncbi:hypothetical protein Peur_015578 [Populus x canadensis]
MEDTVVAKATVLVGTDAIAFVMIPLSAGCLDENFTMHKDDTGIWGLEFPRQLRIKHYSEKEEQDNTDKPQMIRVGMEFRIADVSENSFLSSQHFMDFTRKTKN